MADYTLFRFYAELNDFFTAKRHPKGQSINPVEGYVRRLKDGTTVKDSLEAMGVPHTEVALVLVDNNPVDFSYILRDGQRVAVFPPFCHLPVAEEYRLMPEYSGEPRFVLDSHLGRLAKYLRILGFDTLYRNDFSDEELARISGEEIRILLTRDVGLLKRKEIVFGYWLRETNSRLQLREVDRRYSLQRFIHPMTRCLKCNSLLRAVDKTEVEELLLPDTRKYFQEFYQCQGCGQVYWMGNHFQKMMGFVREWENPGEHTP